MEKNYSNLSSFILQRSSLELRKHDSNSMVFLPSAVSYPSRIRMVILQDFARIWQNHARRYIVLQEFLPESCKILQDNHFLQESGKIANRSARILKDNRSFCKNLAR